MNRICNILLIFSLFLSTSARASSSLNGNVAFIYMMGNGTALFSQDGPARSSPPPCGNPNPNRWAIDGNTPAGQNKIALLMTAKALNKGVQVYGTGTCPDWGDTESVDYIVMNP